jgi:hypothetical protein
LGYCAGRGLAGSLFNLALIGTDKSNDYIIPYQVYATTGDTRRTNLEVFTRLHFNMRFSKSFPGKSLVRVTYPRGTGLIQSRLSAI